MGRVDHIISDDENGRDLRADRGRLDRVGVADRARPHVPRRPMACSDIAESHIHIRERYFSMPSAEVGGGLFTMVRTSITPSSFFSWPNVNSLTAIPLFRCILIYFAAIDDYLDGQCVITCLIRKLVFCELCFAKYMSESYLFGLKFYFCTHGILLA